VSVIIPCYNAEKYVGETIESVLRQTYRRTEVIVIDDGSTDDSLDRVKSFGDRSRWETGPNRGGCAARNRGVKMATGDYIQFLDADDLMEPEKIECQMAALAELPADSIATCAWNHFTAEGGHAPPYVRPFWKSYQDAIDLLVDMWLLGGFFTPHCWLIPKDIIERVGPWSESLLADQDGDFFGRVLTQAASVAFVEGCSVHYRTPALSNVSASADPRAVESRFRAWESVQAHLLARRDDPDARRAVLRRLRSVTYSYAQNDKDLVQKAAHYETQFRVADFDPEMPPVIRYLIGLFGIKRGLMVRGLLKH
jgi:glycosyltransferase involved in cell wall biosynthesis